MARHNRILSLIMTIVITVAMVFSVLFIAEEANHICSDNNCEICYQINCCLKLINTISFKPVTFAAILATAFIVALVIGTVEICRNCKSLVILKVKLSN